jgi:hypothetical protein
MSWPSADFGLGLCGRICSCTNLLGELAKRDIALEVFTDICLRMCCVKDMLAIRKEGSQLRCNEKCSYKKNRFQMAVANELSFIAN